MCPAAALVACGLTTAAAILACTLIRGAGKIAAPGGKPGSPRSVRVRAETLGLIRCYGGYLLFSS